MYHHHVCEKKSVHNLHFVIASYISVTESNFLNWLHHLFSTLSSIWLNKYLIDFSAGSGSFWEKMTGLRQRGNAVS